MIRTEAGFQKAKESFRKQNEKAAIATEAYNRYLVEEEEKVLSLFTKEHEEDAI